MPSEPRYLPPWDCGCGRWHAAYEQPHCRICGESGCRDCLVRCWSCGEWVCAAHMVEVPLSNDAPACTGCVSDDWVTWTAPLEADYARAALVLCGACDGL